MNEMCSEHNRPITIKAGYGDFCMYCIEEQGMTDMQRIEIRLKRIEETVCNVKTSQIFPS